jgi:MFS family permease
MITAEHPTTTEATTPEGYGTLFRQREFRALWTGNALGTAATTMSSLGLGLVVHAETGSPLLTALVMFGPSLVQVLGAGTLMSLADTAPPRLVLSAVSALMAAGFAVQALFDLPPTGRLMIVFGAAYALSIGGGVRWGLLSEVVPTSRYVLARSAMNVSVGAMQIVGFAVGGLLLTRFSVGVIFWIAVALACIAVITTWSGIGTHPPRRTARPSLSETWRGNKILLGRPSTRALLVALCVPNGLVAGCEALFVPYAGESAAFLFVAAAVGMLVGDVLMGRILGPRQQRAAVGSLRFLLAAPFLIFLWQPGAPLAAIAVGVASVGYAASLGQQELLLRLVPREVSGQVLGAESAARVTCQGLAAVLAGTLAEAIPTGIAIALLGLGSLIISLCLTPTLRQAAREAAAPAEPGPIESSTSSRFAEYA